MKSLRVFLGSILVVSALLGAAACSSDSSDAPVSTADAPTSTPDSKPATADAPTGTADAKPADAGAGGG